MYIQKAELRKQLKAKRKLLTEEYIRKASATIFETIKEQEHGSRKDGIISRRF